ncbi:hypothetical protein PWT90_09022 [Aphanocladium album]|nr:hypothetical protein PWT90_09022 [Aphanocladium album]
MAKIHACAEMGKEAVAYRKSPTRMHEISDLQKEICDLVRILSFITPRATDFEHDRIRTAEPPGRHEPEYEPDVVDEVVDENELEDMLVPGGKEIECIKSDALDRIAEILAKFKTKKGTTTSNDRHRDAKHVTSVIMVENTSNRTAKFFCAKNEGLDENDGQLLQALEQLYQSIRNLELEQSESVERILDLMFAHQAHRVIYYSNVLRDAFKDPGPAMPVTTALTAENLQKLPQQRISRTWRDNSNLELDIKIGGPDDDSVSDKTICLSDPENENLVQEVFHDICYQFSKANAVSETLMKCLLKKLYSIVRHPRLRPALKGLLRHTLRGEKRFKHAWSALLYLARIFYAAVSFKQLASRSGFVSITFQQVPVPSAYVPKYSDKETPSRVLKAIDSNSMPSWSDSFSSQDDIKEFIKASRKRKPIHAEVQLITHILQLADDKLGGEVFPYIGCSKNRLLLGPGGVTATDKQMESLPSAGNLGYATLLDPNNELGAAADVPIYDAEKTKINHDRKAAGLEDIAEMPPTQFMCQRLCRRCRKHSNYRCRYCWTFYCSSNCKRYDWATHVFTCRAPNRPNDLDFLRLIIRKAAKEAKTEEDERIHNALIYLFADDHICRTFAFNNCESINEVMRLICLYDTMLRRIRAAVQVLQHQLEAGTLGSFCATFCKLEREVARLTKKEECTCVSWFLNRWPSEQFPIPNMDKEQYDIWTVATIRALDIFGLKEKLSNGFRLNQSCRDVLDLYISIQPTVWRLPDATSSSWIGFGFCLCKSFSQRWQLAQKYLSLASSGATFEDIVSAYETQNLSNLMRARAIDISELESQGILPCRPDPCAYSVFRLMIGVEHALSGRFCGCFRVREGYPCYAYFETFFDIECDTNFGFHLSTSWERWQLLNFYKYLFRQYTYNSRRMVEAMDNAALGSLEAYLETLCPDMRRKLHYENRASASFPRLTARVEFKMPDGEVIRHFDPPSRCKSVFGPPGISFRNFQSTLAQLDIHRRC